MNYPQLPFSQAAQNNQAPILEVLKSYITDGNLLEIGFGNGQHAEYMSEQLKIPWYPTDVAEHIWIIKERRRLKELSFLQAPKVLKISEVSMFEQIPMSFNYIYSANTLHIMGEKEVNTFCEEVTTMLKPEGFLFLYGPFKFSQNFTSDSNRNFDSHLKERNPLSGIRDFEMIESKLNSAGNIVLEKRYDLPANNHLLVFKKLLSK